MERVPALHSRDAARLATTQLLTQTRGKQDLAEAERDKETKRQRDGPRGASQILSDKMESEWPESNQRPIDFREYCRHSIQHYSQSLYQLSYTRTVACYLNKLTQYAARASTHTTTHPTSHSTSYQPCRVFLPPPSRVTTSQQSRAPQTDSFSSSIRHSVQ